MDHINQPASDDSVFFNTHRQTLRPGWWCCAMQVVLIQISPRVPLMSRRRHKYILSTDGLVTHRGGVMWKTPVTKNQAFVHIRSIGRYDSRGTTCHWEIDKKRTTGDLYLPASRAISRRWGRGSWTLPSPR